MAYSETTQTHANTAKKINPFEWLFRAEAAYRDYCKLKSTEDHLLEDMGISRSQADTAFLRQFSENRWYVG